MRFRLTLAALAATANAAYPKDIVQYWVDSSAILVNGTVIGGLQSPPSGWFEAIVQASVYRAALDARDRSKDLAFQQLAVSHAAHDALVWVFHGTRLYPQINNRLRNILPAIGIAQTTKEWARATDVGRKAALEVLTARADDGINYFVDYTVQPADPGVWQPTPGGQPIPDTPQAQYIRLFGGLGDARRFRAKPPPSVKDASYEKLVLDVKQIGERNSSSRTADQTQIAYFWRESSPIQWNRLANLVVGDSLSTDVVASAKFYAQLNYALANAAIASWDTKYFYNAWRPVTAIRRPGIWLATGRDVSQADWTPLLNPTPNHQDYLSTHATFGGAAAAVIRAWNKGDQINVQLSSNVTLDNVGVITRRYTNLTQAAVDNGDSRIFGGIHFQFASDVGREIGDWVGRETLKVFDRKWDEF